MLYTVLKVTQDGYMNKTPLKKQTPTEILNDPKRVCVSMSEAAEILGIAKSTAHSAYSATGSLIEGVPVMRVGKRLIVSLFALRAALAIESAAEQDDDNV